MKGSVEANLQSAMKGTQSSDRFGLHARHSKEVLEICEIGGELGQLRM